MSLLFQALTNGKITSTVDKSETRKIKESKFLGDNDPKFTGADTNKFFLSDIWKWSETRVEILTYLARQHFNCGFGSLLNVGKERKVVLPSPSSAEHS